MIDRDAARAIPLCSTPLNRHEPLFIGVSPQNTYLFIGCTYFFNLVYYRHPHRDRGRRPPYCGVVKRLSSEYAFLVCVRCTFCRSLICGTIVRCCVWLSPACSSEVSRPRRRRRHRRTAPQSPARP